MTSDGSRRPSSECDIFDEIWHSITDTASDLTRSLVGLPMFYRYQPLDKSDVLTVFAEPGILSPGIITFSLDRDIGHFMGPYRIESRPVSVFDIFSQGFRPRYPTGMMFLFGSPDDNVRGSMDRGTRFFADSIFRPLNYHELIRRSITPWTRMLINLGFDEIKEIEETLDLSSNHVPRPHEEPQVTDTVMAKVREVHRPWDTLERHTETNLESFANRGDANFKSYTTETKSTTNITRNADGSIHKETVTTERLSDGSSKMTRILQVIPTEGDARPSKTETTITTTPARESSNSMPTHNLDATSKSLPAQSDLPHQVDEKSIPRDTPELGKGNELGKDQKDWTWWYWSKK
jgi:hypothetical protein